MKNGNPHRLGSKSYDVYIMLQMSPTYTIKDLRLIAEKCDCHLRLVQYVLSRFRGDEQKKLHEYILLKEVLSYIDFLGDFYDRRMKKLPITKREKERYTEINENFTKLKEDFDLEEFVRVKEMEEVEAMREEYEELKEKTEFELNRKRQALIERGIAL